MANAAMLSDEDLMKTLLIPDMSFTLEYFEEGN